jgi:O-antigen ligase
MIAMTSRPPEPSSRLLATWRRLYENPTSRQAMVLAAFTLLGLVWGAGVAVGGMGAALLCISLVACICCVIDFRVGVMLLIIMMPISSSVLFPHAMFGLTGLNPLNLLLVATLGVFMMRTIGTGGMKGFVPRPLLLLYIAPITVGALIGMNHVHEIPTLFKSSEVIFFDTPLTYLRDMLLKPMGVVVFAVLIGAAVGRSKQPEKFVTPMLLSVFVMALLSIVFVASSGVSLSQLAGTYSRHFFSQLGMHANDLGRLYAAAYALLLFVWDRSERIFLKTVLLFAMGMVALALFFTFSRGAFFGFIVVNVIYLFSRRTMKTFLLAVVVIPLVLILAPGALWSRVEMGIGQGLNEITAGRVDEIWIPLLPEIFSSPPWGRGMGSIMWTDAMKFDLMAFVGHPHNAYFQAYMDLGLIGGGLVLAFWIYGWMNFRRLAKDKRVSGELQGFFEGAAAGVASFLIAGIAGSSLMPVPEQGFLWLALGVMWGVQRHLSRLAPAAKPAAAVGPMPVFSPAPTFSPAPEFSPAGAFTSAPRPE